MLDDNTIIPVPRVALVDSGLFTKDTVQLILDWELIRQLSLLPHNWRLWYVYMDTHAMQETQLLEMLETYGLRFDMVRKLNSGSLVELQTLAHIADLGFLPRVGKILPVNFLLRSPADPKQMADLLVYFSESIEPFSPDNYYRFLNTYGARTN